MKEFHYVCPNIECPCDETSTDIYTLVLPLYVEHDFKSQSGGLQIFNMDQLMSLYTDYGERAYYVIDSSNFINNICRVISVKTYINNGDLYIQYIFENNAEFSFDTQYMDSLSERDLENLADIAKEAADFIFYLNKPLRNNDLKFEREFWGDYHDA